MSSFLGRKISGEREGKRVKMKGKEKVMEGKGKRMDGKLKGKEVEGLIFFPIS